MGEQENKSKKAAFGVKFTEENLAYLKESGNVTAKVNEIIESVRTGKVEVAGHPLAPLSTVCIFDLPMLKDGCPVRKKNEFLQKAVHFDALIKACSKCPLLKIHIEMERNRNRIKSPVEPRASRPAPAAPSSHKLVKTSPPRPCKNEGCGVMLVWVEGQRLPIEYDTQMPHYCQYYRRPAAAPQVMAPLAEKDNGVTVTCGQCPWGHQSYCIDASTFDSLLDELLRHVKDKHGRTALNDKETAQMRSLQERLPSGGVKTA